MVAACGALMTTNPLANWPSRASASTISRQSISTALPLLTCSAAWIVRHGRYVVFQLAEVVVPRTLFAAILCRIDRLRPRPPPLPA